MCGHIAIDFKCQSCGANWTTDNLAEAFGLPHLGGMTKDEHGNYSTEAERSLGISQTGMMMGSRTPPATGNELWKRCWDGAWLQGNWGGRRIRTIVSWVFWKLGRS